MITQAALSLREVFSIPKYAALAITTAAIVLIVALWLPNMVLLREIAMSDAVPFTAKLRILAGLLGTLTTNYSPATGTALVIVSLLFGVNVSFFVHAAGVRRKAVVAGGSGLLASFGGLTSSLVGVGCAACGTFLLGPFFALFGAGTLIGALPFGGEEFIIVGIALLIASLWFHARAAGSTAICVSGNLPPSPDSKEDT